MTMKDRYGNELGTQSAAARDAYQAGMDSWTSSRPPPRASMRN